MGSLDIEVGSDGQGCDLKFQDQGPVWLNLTVPLQNAGDLAAYTAAVCEGETLNSKRAIKPTEFHRSDPSPAAGQAYLDCLSAQASPCRYDQPARSSRPTRLHHPYRQPNAIQPREA